MQVAESNIKIRKTTGTVLIAVGMLLLVTTLTAPYLAHHNSLRFTLAGMALAIEFAGVGFMISHRNATATRQQKIRNGAYAVILLMMLFYAFYCLFSYSTL